MKTITEFTGIHLKNASKLKADLTAAGKTAEELAPAMGETLKLEGDKLTHLLAAVETVGDKLNELKRVVVFTAAEGEKTPGSAQRHGEHFYLPEYYAPIGGKKPAGKEADGRGGKRDGKGRGRKGGRGGKGGDREGGGRGPRRDRGPRDAQAGGKPGEPVVHKITPKGAAPSAPADKQS